MADITCEAAITTSATHDPIACNPIAWFADKDDAEIFVADGKTLRQAEKELEIWKSQYDILFASYIPLAIEKLMDKLGNVTDKAMQDILPELPNGYEFDLGEFLQDR